MATVAPDAPIVLEADLAHAALADRAADLVAARPLEDGARGHLDGDGRRRLARHGREDRRRGAVVARCVVDARGLLQALGARRDAARRARLEFVVALVVVRAHGARSLERRTG
jgi:hypothetical protein